MKGWNRIPLLVGLLLTCVLVMNPSDDLQACMGDCSICGAIGCSACVLTGDGGVSCSSCGVTADNPAPTAEPTVVNFLGRRRAQIIVQGYKTTHLEPSTSCVTALSPVEGVERVNSITNHNSDTGRRFKEVSFFSSERPGRELAGLAGEEGLPLGDQETWFGFQSKITGTVEDNVDNHFVIDVTLREGVSPAEFVEALRNQGVFVTSSSTPDGVPNRGHQYFRRLSSTDVLVRFPQRPEVPEKGRP